AQSHRSIRTASTPSSLLDTKTSGITGRGRTLSKGVPMRRILLLTAFVAVLTSSVALAKASFPDVIALPNGWQPEGIAMGKGTTFYVGSIPTGAIYRGDLRTGKGSTLVTGAAGARAGRRAAHP